MAAATQIPSDEIFPVSPARGSIRAALALLISLALATGASTGASPRRAARTAADCTRTSTGLRALNAVPAVNDLPPGWVTALDLPLIPGAGTIR